VSGQAKRGSVLVAALLGVLTMAPTVGDVGGCGREATSLDRDNYAAARKEDDCRRCGECGIDTARCQRACDPALAPEIVVPDTCRPLLHDGEVCLRALRAASCGAYATYMDDEAPAIPSECAFCREPPPPPPGQTLGEGGAR
jgi:hypothetical protein